MDDVETVIKSILINELFIELPADRLGLDDKLRSDLGVDSLGFVELRVQCEDRFGVQIRDEEFSPENFTSVRTVATLVRDLQNRSEIRSPAG
jgi:acyl carrier protein